MSLTNRKSMEPWLRDSVDYYPHQVEGVRKMARMRNFLLADDMGLGKSLQALTVFVIDVVRGYGDKGLVVCPVTLKGNWADELDKFTRIPYTVLDGSPKQRAAQLDEFKQVTGPKILITNYEQAIPHWKDFNTLQFDMGIYDEAHYLKNPRAKRTKACLSIQSTRSALLTGTPMLNHVNELFTLLHKIDPAGYPNYWSFVNRYAVFGGYKNKAIVGIKNEKELIERLHSVMIRRLKKDVLDLPEVQKIVRRIDLFPAQRKMYDQAAQDLTLPTPEGMDDVEIDNALTKFLRLKQICGTTLPFTGEDISAKLDQVVEDSIEILTNGNKVIFFTQFRDVLECYAQRMDKALKDVNIWELHGDIPTGERPGIAKQWAADPNPGVIACMLQVASVGLNLTAARFLQFADKLFVPGLNQQAIDRAHRIGQSTTQPVQVLEYICKNTVESRVERILTTKTGLFNTVVNESDWKRKLYAALAEDEDV